MNASAAMTLVDRGAFVVLVLGGLAAAIAVAVLIMLWRRP